jgi:hypothetical protein
VIFGVADVNELICDLLDHFNRSLRKLLKGIIINEKNDTCETDYEIMFFAPRYLPGFPTARAADF